MDYEYKKENEHIEELSLGKTVLFFILNQDSQILFYGISELINAISMMYLFNLEPENIQIIFFWEYVSKRWSFIWDI